MKKIQLILLTAITLLMTACGTTQTVPLTGRKHRIGVSDEQLLSLLTSSLRTPRNINLTIFLGKNAKNRAFLV